VPSPACRCKLPSDHCTIFARCGGSLCHHPLKTRSARQCALGEIAFRVNNLDAMQRFYEQAIGLPLMTRDQNCAFFRIADGYGGHTQVLALCSTDQGVTVIAAWMQHFHRRPHRVRDTTC
jgi:hypothetical protein